MSGMRERTGLEETGARLGELLRRALRDRLARRMDEFSRAAKKRQEAGERGRTGMPELGRAEQDILLQDRGEAR